MTDQKPTGVFVPLHEGQLREDQIAKICNPKLTMTESLLAIGTPVQESGLTCIGNIVWFENDREPVLGSYVPAVFKQGSGVPVASLHEAQAQIAARDAEIGRLHVSLVVARNAITSDLNAKSIVCTVWAGPAETLVDYIDAALKGGAA